MYPTVLPLRIASAAKKAQKDDLPLSGLAKIIPRLPRYVPATSSDNVIIGKGKSGSASKS